MNSKIEKIVNEVGNTFEIDTKVKNGMYNYLIRSENPTTEEFHTVCKNHNVKVTRNVLNAFNVILTKTVVYRNNEKFASY